VNSSCRQRLRQFWKTGARIDHLHAEVAADYGPLRWLEVLVVMRNEHPFGGVVGHSNERAIPAIANKLIYRTIKVIEEF
jgi:hypothetical protein